jgi:predicted DNA-binding protein YlxM (UPF0122 family)
LADEDGNGTVRFAVKDLLTKIDVKLEKIDMKLDMKADRERVHELAGDLSALQLKVALAERVAEELPTTLDRVESLERWRTYISGITVVLTVLVVPLALIVAQRYL